MSEQMFCFQCEQTAGGKGCTGAAGVCGKPADTALLQDELTGALIGLALSLEGKEECRSVDTDRLLIKGLFSTVTNVNYDSRSLLELIGQVEEAMEQWATPYPGCVSYKRGIRTFDMRILWEEQEDIRSLKSLILFGLKGMAAYAYHADALGYREEKVNRYFYKALAVIGKKGCGMEKLLPLLLETGEMSLRCMELLDRANTETFGEPKPVKVSMTIKPGPFIVVTGHDFLDLKLLLEQTAGTGIHVYTHGEMLPAHGYPELAEYSHLKGNFGTAWQNQIKEFSNLPAPVVFTANCLMPPQKNYLDRVFTTGPVHYPGAAHVGDKKDFMAVILKALVLGGYAEEQYFNGANGGDHITTGYGRHFLLSHKDQIADAVRSGAVRHIFLVGGCDGARKGRNFYTKFVKNTPKDSLILTLGCGKYRFNDLDLGSVAGFPRIMDVGQCNDAYAAIQIVLALGEAFSCDVNELPLTIVLSWYEQKAVSVLLSLLYLGIRNIRIGPTLPAFMSPNVWKYLVREFGLTKIGGCEPENDPEHSQS